MAKRSIDDYKDRLGSPVGAVQIDPKTGKTIKAGKKSAGTKKTTANKRKK